MKRIGNTLVKTAIAVNKGNNNASQKWINLTYGKTFSTKGNNVLSAATNLSSSTSSGDHSLKNIRHKANHGWTPKLIIFDKNGTLLDFHIMWTPWVKAFGERLNNATGLQIEEKLYKRLNVCIFTKRTRPGLLAEGSSCQIKREIVALLTEAGIPEVSGKTIVEECWEDCDISNPRTMKELLNLKQLFEVIKNQGIKIAICTSDTRKSTERTLNTLDLLSYVDVLKCEDDKITNPKHDPCTVHNICDELGLQAKDAAVIGDTEADVSMGFNAGAGLTVGVLSGTGTRLDLAPYSDYIVEDIKQFVDGIIPNTSSVNTDKAQHSMVKRLRTTEDGPKAKASLVIFDKDGTLLCFHSMWTPWAKDVITRLESETDLKLYDQVMSELGYDKNEQKWVPGVLAQGTQHQNKEIVKAILQNKGLEEEEANKAIENSWIPGNHDTSSDHLRLLDNPTALFKILKENGVKVAVCTSDSRAGTNQFLESIGAEKYVDLVVCGDDPKTEPKPSPKNALFICETLGIDPSKTIVVGDTIADMEMGKSAKLGATVAVLSGVGGVDDLKDTADHMVSSISQILPVVFGKTSNPDNEKIG